MTIERFSTGQGDVAAAKVLPILSNEDLTDPPTISPSPDLAAGRPTWPLTLGMPLLSPGSPAPANRLQALPTSCVFFVSNFRRFREGEGDKRRHRRAHRETPGQAFCAGRTRRHARPSLPSTSFASCAIRSASASWDARQRWRSCCNWLNTLFRKPGGPADWRILAALEADGNSQAHELLVRGVDSLLWTSARAMPAAPTPAADLVGAWRREPGDRGTR